MSDIWDTSPGVMQLRRIRRRCHNYGKLTTEDIGKLVILVCQPFSTGFPEWLRDGLVTKKTIVGYPGEVTGNVARISANDVMVSVVVFWLCVNLRLLLAMYYAAIANVACYDHCI